MSTNVATGVPGLLGLNISSGWVGMAPLNVLWMNNSGPQCEIINDEPCQFTKLYLDSDPRLSDDRDTVSQPQGDTWLKALVPYCKFFLNPALKPLLQNWLFGQFWALGTTDFPQNAWQISGPIHKPSGEAFRTLMNFQDLSHQPKPTCTSDFEVLACHAQITCDARYTNSSGVKLVIPSRARWKTQEFFPMWVLHWL